MTLQATLEPSGLEADFRLSTGLATGLAPRLAVKVCSHLSTEIALEDIRPLSVAFASF
jgi:hypothetical protein